MDFFIDKTADNIVEKELTEKERDEVINCILDKKKLPEKILYKNKPNLLNLTTMPEFLRNIKKVKRIIERFVHQKAIITIFGEPASCKSILANYIACCISTGAKFFGKYKTIKLPVLYLSSENPQRIDAVRFKAIFKGMKINAIRRALKNLHLFYCERKDIGILNDEIYFSKLENTIRDEGIKVLIIDTLSPMILDLDDNKASEVVFIFKNRLEPLVDNYGITIIFLMHSQKSGRDFLGSVKFKASVDAFYELKREEDKLSFLSHKDREKEHNLDFRIKFENKNEELKIIHFEHLEEYEGKQSPNNKNNNPVKSEQTKEIILNLLKEKELKYKEIVENCISQGFAVATIKRAINSLWETKKIYKKQGKEGGYCVS